jgi:threonine dehydratase
MDVARVVDHPTAAHLESARTVVSAHLPPTPLLPLTLPDGREIRCKLECAQPTGSFKVRGALAALAAYRGAERFVTASAGNHGLGVAYAAQRLGVRATIVVPRTASAAKVESLQRLGADLVQHGDRYEDAEAHALAQVGEGDVYVSAYNDPHVIAGQATCVVEIIQQSPAPCTVVVPMGGGGLIAGAVLEAARHTGIQVMGVEAEASRAVSTAVQQGRIVEVPVGPTLADGLAGNMEVGTVTPAIISGRVEAFAAVSEDEIAEAIRFLAMRAGWVVEGSGAVGVAALIAGKLRVEGPIVALLTGRNIAAPTLARVLAGA